MPLYYSDATDFHL